MSIQHSDVLSEDEPSGDERDTLEHDQHSNSISAQLVQPGSVARSSLAGETAAAAASTPASVAADGSGDSLDLEVSFPLSQLFCRAVVSTTESARCLICVWVSILGSACSKGAVTTASDLEVARVRALGTQIPPAGFCPTSYIGACVLVYAAGVPVCPGGSKRVSCVALLPDVRTQQPCLSECFQT